MCSLYPNFHKLAQAVFSTTYLPYLLSLSRHSDLSQFGNFGKTATPTPPYFAMYVQIKGLQRSVVHVCANKRLSANYHFRNSAGTIPNPSTLIFTPRRRPSPKRLIRRQNRRVNILIRMRPRNKRRLKLRWRQ